MPPWTTSIASGKPGEAGFYFHMLFLLFPHENHQRQAGLRLFRVRNIVLIRIIVYFPDWGEKRKLTFRSTKTVGFHGGEQGFSYRPVLSLLFLIDLLIYFYFFLEKGRDPIY